MMNGILVVDKPQGFTSFDVVAKLRGICQTKKIGHGGTLDPMATGVLPVFVGPAVKAVDLAPRQDKTYEAEMLLGVKTDTGDITGQVLEQAEAGVTADEIQAVLPRFTGPQQQLPPMYSAVKIDGKPLYRYAREGKAVECRPRAVEIFSLELMQAPLPADETAQPGGDAANEKEENRFALRVHCSKGTYIRTLVEDIGAALGLPATLAALRRTGAGAFDLGQAHGLDEIQQARDEGRLEALFLPLETVFAGLPRCEVGEAGLARLLNGAPVYGLRGAAERCAIYSGGAFIGLGRVAADGMLKGEKLFVARD